MTRIKGGPIYVQDHRHSFPYLERKNRSVVIGACDICGSSATPSLMSNGWDWADEDEQDDEEVTE